MELGFSSTISIDISAPKLKEIVKAFISIMKVMLEDFIKQVLREFADHYMLQDEKPFNCECCGNKRDFIWKTHHGRQTSIVTIFFRVRFPQLQIQCKKCGHKMYITRELLGIEKRKLIPKETIRKLGLIGSLTTFRVAEKIVGMFGVVLDKMSIWRSVQGLSEEIKLGIDSEERCAGEADGTGIPIQGVGKRGKEMKVFVQLRKRGGVRVAGLSTGNYDRGWNKLFKPLLPGIKSFKEFLLITDGDTNILKGLGKKVSVVFQRCLWHIPHQFKWYLWKDGIKRKTVVWKKALSELLSITNTKGLQHDKECIEGIVSIKKERLERLIEYCRERGMKHSVSYLENAKPSLFVSLSKRLNGKTTSHVERVMRTINMRVNVGKWSPQGALDATKIRLAYYYNGFDVE
jgi:hypothetical protein